MSEYHDDRLIFALWRFVAAKWRHQTRQCVHFIHLGKTGGSAIRGALSDHLLKGKYKIKLHGHNMRLRDIAVGERAFFFVRDPVTRFISGFFGRLRQGKPLYDFPWSVDEERAFGEFHTANDLALAISSSRASARSSALEAMKTIGHVNSSYWDWFENESYFQSRLSDVFFIGFQENLSVDFEKLKLKLGLPQNVVLPLDDLRAHRNPLGSNVGLSTRR